MNPLSIDPRAAALVLIDLQQGVVGLPVAPYSAADVVNRAAGLAQRFRRLSAPVILVRVAFSPDGGDMLAPAIDTPWRPPGGERPANWIELVPAVGPLAGDIVVTKRNWGAFYGTDLDLQLRRRGVRTIVLAGIATNFGVESTARDAFERNYEQVLVEDAMAALSAEAHAFAVTMIFPRLGRVRSTQEVLAALPNPS